MNTLKLIGAAMEFGRKLKPSMSFFMTLAMILVSATSGLSQSKEQAWKVADERAKQGKAAMTQFERKLSWHILSMLRELEVQNVAKSNVNTENLIKKYKSPIMQFDDSGRILCHIWLKDALSKGMLTNTLKRIDDVKIVNSEENFKFIVAYIPFYSAMEVAKIPDVRFVDPVIKDITKTGNVNSEADAILQANLARQFFAFSGAGVRIGVISDGINPNGQPVDDDGDLGIADPELPPIVTSVTGLDVIGPQLYVINNSNANNTAEGTAMLEIIHDLCPDADLVFAYGSIGLGTFDDAVQDLANAGCDIIVDDISNYQEPYFQENAGLDEPIFQEINDFVLNRGGVYLSSVGNSADKHYETQYTDNDNNNIHNLSQSDEALDFEIKPGGSITVYIQWSNDWGNVTTDIDAQLWEDDPIGDDLVDEDLDNNIGGNPFITLTYTNSSSITDAEIYLRILHDIGPTNARLEVYWELTGTESNLTDAQFLVPEGSSWGHPVFDNVIAVGAIPFIRASTGNDNSPYEVLAEYSSYGPCRIYTNFTTQQYIERDKPDITAMDGIHVSGAFGFGHDDGGGSPGNIFWGTSAAAPHAAAIAGLIGSTAPTLSRDQIITILQNSAGEKGPYSYSNQTGMSKETGHGRIDAYDAIRIGRVQSLSYVYTPKFLNCYTHQQVKDGGRNPGAPTEDVQSNWNGYEKQKFENGAIVYQLTNSEAYWLGEGIFNKWIEPSVFSLIGSPISNEYKDANNNGYPTVDFVHGRIFWDGTTAHCIINPVDVALVIDRSGSMGGQKIIDAKTAAKTFVGFMQPGDNSAVVSFESSATVNFPLTTIVGDATRTAAQNAINGINAGGGTSIGAGMQLGQIELNKGDPNHPHAMMLLSDGMENAPPFVANILPTIPQKTDIYTIGLGADADQGLLSQIASTTGGEYHFAPNSEQLQGIYLRIRGKITGQQTLASYTSTITQGGTKIHSVTLDALTSLATFSMTFQGSDVDLELVTPAGKVINPQVAASDPNISYTEGATYDYYTISAPEAGNWTLRILGVSVPSPESYFATVQVSSQLKMDVVFDKNEYNVSEPILVSAKLEENGQAITNASVTAEVTLPSSSMFAYQQATASHNGEEKEARLFNKTQVSQANEYNSPNVSNNDQSLTFISETIFLFDDGFHSDGAANDGVYANFFTNTVNDGSYTFTVRASGTASQSGAFMRENTISTFVKPSTSPLISNVQPNSAQTGQTLNVAANGANFVNGAAVSFSGPGITVNSTSFINSTQLSVNITIASNALPGPRDVIVTNPNGQHGTGQGLFTITSGCTSTFNDNFDDGNANGWQPRTPSQWGVVSVGGNPAYCLTVPDPTTDEYSLLAGKSWDNFTMEIEAKASATSNKNFFLLFGVFNPSNAIDNSYYLQFALGGVRLFRTIAGSGAEIAFHSADLVSDNNFHKIRVVRQAPNIKAYADGQLVIDINDATFANGLIGFGSFKSTACFDEVSITCLGGGNQVGPLIYSSHFIDDVPGGTSTNGDGDGRAESGEHVALAVTLLNQGTQTAVGVGSSTLTCSDPDIIIKDSNNCWPDIPGGQTKENACNYEFQVNPNLAQNKMVSFSMTVTAQNGGPWTSTFAVQIYLQDLIAPSNLTASALNSTAVQLNWQDKSSTEQGFKIERKTGAGGSWSEIATVGANVTSYVNSSLGTNQTYFYRVRAYSGSNNSNYSNEPDAVVMASPTGLVATAISNSQINLSWVDNTALETGYKIERKTGASGSWAEIATVGANVVSYSNTGLQTNTQYYYRVRAFANSTTATPHYSFYSNEANAVTAGISAPSNLAALANGTTVNLSWQDNSNNEQGFKIERKTGASGSWSEITTVGANVISYVNSGLGTNQTYFYRVRAYSGSDNSNYSNEPDAAVMASPSGLVAAAISSSQINLNWVDNTALETGYKIERKTGASGSWAEIATVGANVISYSNTGLQANTQYYYRLRAYANSTTATPHYSFYSNEANGTTLGGESIIVTSPNGGENWIVGNQYPITWQQTGLTTVKLEYSTDNGGSWKLIANNISAGVALSAASVQDEKGQRQLKAAAVEENDVTQVFAGSYSWTIPNDPSTQSRVRISDANDGLPNDISDNVFTISPSPDGAQTYTSADIPKSFGQTSATSTLSIPSGAGVINDFNVSVNITHTWVGDIKLTLIAPNGKSVVLFSDPADPNGSNDYLITTFDDESSNTYVPGSGNVQLNVKPFSALSLFDGDNASGTWKLLLEDIYSDADHGTLNSWSVTITTGGGGGISAPSNLTALANGTTVSLSWQDNSSNEQGFKIERKTGASGSWSEITTVGANVISYVNSGLGTNQTYSYRVRAYSGSNNSNYSNEPDAAVMASPSGLAATAISSNQINLSWVDNTALETGYKIERKTGANGSWSEVATVGVNVTSYSNTGLQANTQYYYRVRAYANSTIATPHFSFYSNEANTTTLGGQSITLTSPNGGENWIVGNQYPITWQQTGLTTVKLEYSTDNGGNWKLIANNISAGVALSAASVQDEKGQRRVVGAEQESNITQVFAGSYPWTVPNDPSTQSRVRVSDASDGLPIDISDNVFTIGSSTGGPKTYTSIDVPKSFGQTSATSTITLFGIPENTSVISDFDVSVNITHTWVGDIELILTAPSGKSVVLFGDPADPNGPNDYLITTFDDESPNTYVPGSGNVTLNIKPFSALSVLDGEKPGGLWKLLLQDIYPSADDGTLNSWSITITTIQSSGNNLALNRPVTVNSVFSNSYPGSNAVDGNPSTYWRSASGTSSTIFQWLYVDLGANFNLNQAKVNWGGDVYFARRYRIQTWESGVWTTHYADNNGNGGIDVINLNGVNTQFVAVACDEANSSDYSYIIAELEVYGSGSTISNASALRVSSPTSTGQSPKLPTSFGLQQNYPNPFNPRTEIFYQIPKSGHVSLKIFNTVGQPVRTLVNNEQQPGIYKVSWDAKDDQGRPMSSGFYFFTLRVGEFQETRKVLLMR